MHTFRFLRWSVAPLLLACTTLASADCISPVWSLMGRVGVDNRPDSVEAADLNGDGKPDLVVSGDGSVKVILNGGNGTFGAATQVYTGTLQKTLVLAEFTGGGGIDAALLDNTTARIIVLPGNGNGTFAAPLTTALPALAQNLAAGDFDEDTKLDLLVTMGSQARIYRGTGSGTFTSMTTMVLPGTAGGSVAADLDGDGNLDAAVSVESRLELFFGNGNGTFTATFSHPAFYYASRMRAADFDQDGKLDLVGEELYTLAAMRNLTGRTFGDPLRYQWDSNGLEVGKLNGDEHPDVLVPLDDTEIGSFMGTATGALERGGSWYIDDGSFWDNLEDSALADFDGDGRLDAAVVANLSYYNNPQRYVTIARNRCGESDIQFASLAPVVSDGQPARFQVWVTPPRKPDEWNFTVWPTGTVTLRNGETVVATAELGDEAVILETTLPVGTHTLTVSYGGDAQYNPAVSEPVQQRVITGTTTTSLTLEDSTVEYGQYLVLNTSVTSTEPGTPTGLIRFSLDGVPLFYNQDAVAAPGGTRYQSTAGTTFGTHTVSARYEGDANHPPSTSVTRTYLFKKATPSVQVNAYSSFAGEPFTLVLSLGNPHGGSSVNRPDGTVTTFIDGTSLGTQTIGSNYPTYENITLGAGSHTIRIEYSGDENYVASTVSLNHITFTRDVPAFDARGELAGVRVVRNVPYGWSVRRRVGLSPISTWCCYDNGSLDTEALPGTVYVYTYDAGGEVTFSDVAQRISFTDDLNLPGKPIRALHVAEIVAGTNKLRAAANLTPVSLANATSPHAVTAAHVQTLRTAINQARTALGAAPFPFAEPISPGGVIRALHVQELREAIR